MRGRKTIYPMKTSRLLLVATLAISGAAIAQQSQLKDPPGHLDEHRRFMLPAKTGMSAAERLAGYEQRLRMEAESPFSQIRWRNIGPEIQGGRVIDIRVPSGRPDIMYVAYASGGLWKTEDQGNNWTPLFDRQSAISLGNIAVSRDGNTVWVGTGENNSQRTSYTGTGVFKSTDGGKTWQNMGLHETHRIGRVLIDPKNENTVWVGAIGALYSQNPNRGIYKTTDGGKTWQWSLKLNEYTGVIDMEMDPRDPNVVYAAAWERDRRAWNFREGGPGSAIYKTTDGGKTWNKLTNGLPNGPNVGRIGLAISPSHPNTIYALIDDQNPDEDTLWRDEYQPSGVLTARRFKLMTEDQFVELDRGVLNRFVSLYLPQGTRGEDLIAQVKEGKLKLDDIAEMMERRNPRIFHREIVNSSVYRSDDAGRSWRKTHPRTLGSHLGYYAGEIHVHPKNPDDVLFGGVLMLRSQDGGRTWFRIAERVHVDFHAYYIDPNNPNFHAVGNDGGLYFSFDDAKTWRHINNKPTGQFTTIAVDTKIPYNVYGGLQDNGTMRGPSNYVPGRSPLHQWTTIGGGDGSALAVDPRDGGDLVYGASQFGAHWALDQKTGQRYNTRPPGPRGGPALRFNWVSPFIISPHHPDIVYCGSQFLHRSLDRGRTWEIISPDLTKNLPNGNVPFSTLKELSESPLKFGLIYAGADDGSVHVTRDHGNTWQAIPTPQPDKWVTRVVASKWDVGTVYVTQNGYRDDEFNPYVWKSTDYGKTWTSISNNLPKEQINVIREDPKHRNILYVGTGYGVFVSLNGGQAWEALSGGIPRAPVHDLVIHERDDEMVIGTHSRSVWILPLRHIRELNDELRNTGLKLWALDNMTRNRTWEYRRKPEWDSSNLDAPVLRAQAWSKNPGQGWLRIRDKEGKVVKEQEVDFARGYNFLEIDLELRPRRPFLVDPKTQQIRTAQDAVRDPYEDERPMYLAAGDYTVEIEVNGLRESTTWSLRE
jgi:photosystem II stability/assembly factor-like uncharacterized protein